MNRARVFSGGLLVVAGAVALLGVAGVLDAGAVFAGWWPLAVLALAALMWWGDRRRWTGPALVAVVGALLLVGTTGFVDVDLWAVLWPAIVIVVGVRLLTRRSRPAETPAAADDRVDAFVAFGGTEVAPRSPRFTGGTVGALFGGADVDLRGSVPDPGAELDVFAAFGGADIFVPEGWRVNVHGLPLFGGIENVTAHEALPEDAPVLDLRATVLFGGVEVKH